MIDGQVWHEAQRPVVRHAGPASSWSGGDVKRPSYSHKGPPSRRLARRLDVRGAETSPQRDDLTQVGKRLVPRRMHIVVGGVETCYSRVSVC
jgi:hypothetical protein